MAKRSRQDGGSSRQDGGSPAAKVNHRVWSTRGGVPAGIHAREHICGVCGYMCVREGVGQCITSVHEL